MARGWLGWVASIATFFSIKAYGWCDIRQYDFSVGASYVENDTSVYLNGRINSHVSKRMSGPADIEDTLGLDTHTVLKHVAFKASVCERHHLRLAYALNKRATRINALGEDLNSEEYSAYLHINMELNTSVNDVEYTYDFWQGDKLEVGFLLGIYLSKIEAKIRANGEFSGEYEGEQKKYVLAYSAAKSQKIPMPLMGISTRYQLYPSWTILASARYFEFEVGEAEGKMTDLNLGVEYKATRRLYLTAIATLKQLGLLREAEELSASLDINYVGVYMGVGARF